MSQKRFTLAELPEGKTATIGEVDLQTPIGRRLLELGFLPGTPIKATFRAPLGEPLAFEIRGFHIGLRQCEAALVALKHDTDGK